MLHNYRNDYHQVAMPEILEALHASQDQAFTGYGLDDASKEAADRIRSLCRAPGAEVHLIAGGTATNLVFLDAVLRGYEAVIAAESGHINVHETGAVEATGHKILTVASDAHGKIVPSHFDKIRQLCQLHEDEHRVEPRVLYVSQTTEWGGIYSLAELQALRALCDEQKLYLFVDGARMSVALTAAQSDASIDQIAALADAFYIGGNKAGLLFGEALVIVNPDLQKGFRRSLKRRGLMMAKGFVLGLQFKRFFEDELYLQTGRLANRAAQALAQTLRDHGYTLATEQVSNQIFVQVPPEEGQRLADAFGCECFDLLPNGDEVRRFVTTWSSPQDPTELFRIYKGDELDPQA